MPAAFENGIFTENVPAWHGAGTTVPDEAVTWEAVVDAVPELGMIVHRQPIYRIAGDGKPHLVPDQVAHEREDGTYLGVVGDDYQLVQPHEAFGFMAELLEKGECIVKTAGTLNGGRRMWIAAEAPEPFFVAGEKTEEHRGYWSFINSFDGSTKVGAICGAVRIVCNNTFNAAIADAKREYWFKHTSNVTTRVEEARAALKVGESYWAEYQRIAERAIVMPFSDRQFTGLLDELIPMTRADGSLLTGRKLTNAESERETMRILWTGSDNLQNVRGTAYCAMQVVAEFSDHHIPSKTTSRNSAAQNRLNRVLFDRTLKDRGTALVLTMAEIK